MNYRSAKKLLRISDIISTIYCVLTTIAFGFTIYATILAGSQTENFFSEIGNYTEPSYIAGYAILAEFTGGMLGSIIFLALAILSFFLLVLLILVLIQRMAGLVCFKKIEAPMILEETIRKSLKVNCRIKVVIAAILAAIVVYLMIADGFSLTLTLLILPQAFILYAAVRTLLWLNDEDCTIDFDEDF